LEGGQTKEDQKRDEIFWNETLAPDEIDRLFEPKVLTNFKRFDKDGEHPLCHSSMKPGLSSLKFVIPNQYKLQTSHRSNSSIPFFKITSVEG